MVDRQLDVLVALPDVHERDQSRRHHGRIVVLEKSIEALYQTDRALFAGAPFDEVPVVVVELSHAEGGRLANVGVVVAEEDA